MHPASLWKRAARSLCSSTHAPEGEVGQLPKASKHKQGKEATGWMGWRPPYRTSIQNQASDFRAYLNEIACLGAKGMRETNCRQMGRSFIVSEEKAQKSNHQIVSKHKGDVEPLRRR